MSKLLSQIDENVLQKDVMVQIMALIPCIMHMETRIGIKIPTILLIKGLSSSQGGRLHPVEYSECTTASQREQKYLTKTQDIVNKRILGSKDCPRQWQVPTEKKTGSATSIGIINFENYKVRSIIECIDEIIDASISEPERQDMWGKG